MLGPVRHVLTLPTIALSIEPTPQATVTASTGGSWPAAFSTAKPWPFCTTSTVIASGTTSSTIAAHDHSGMCTTGRTSSIAPSAAVSTRPSSAAAIAPTSSVPIIGGMRRASAGSVASSRKATTIGPAIAMSSCSARTRSSPKRRNTPATMPITIGIGTACMARRTQPLAPSTSISTPVARNAPTTSAKLRCASAGPTSTVPGMVQKKPSGCRYSQLNRMVIKPLMKNTPKTHEASSASDSPPRVPTDRMMASGAVTENTQPMKPLAA